MSVFLSVCLYLSVGKRKGEERKGKERNSSLHSVQNAIWERGKETERKEVWFLPYLVAC